jgi:hypothetical protein
MVAVTRSVPSPACWALGAASDFRSGRALLLDRRSNRADRLVDPRDGSDDAEWLGRLAGPLPDSQDLWRRSFPQPCR